MEETIIVHGAPITITEVVNGFILRIGRELFLVSSERDMDDARERLSAILTHLLKDQVAWMIAMNSRFESDKRPAYNRPADCFATWPQAIDDPL